MPRDDRLPLPRLAARARLVVKASLGWLGGHPRGGVAGGVRWRSAGGDEVVLGAGELRRASLALTELRTELREALPELVPRPERWLEAVDRLLSLLGATVHHGTALPASVWSAGAAGAAALARSRPALAPLLDAASWALALEPWDERRTLAWIERQATPLAAWLGRAGGDADRLGVEHGAALGLVRSALADGGKAAAVLVEALAEPRWDLQTRRKEALGHVHALRLLTHAKRWRTSTPADVPPTPAGHGTRRVVDFALRWQGWDRRRRKRAARLLELASPALLLPAWERWWRRVEREAKRLRGLAQVVRRKDVPIELEQVDRRLAAMVPGASRDRLPPDLDLDGVLDAVERLSAPEPAALAEAAVRTLAALPRTWRGTAARTAFLLWWSLLARGEDAAYVRRVTSVVEGLRRLLERAGVAALQPWAGVAERARRGEDRSWILDRRLVEQRWARRELADPEVAAGALAAATLSPDAAELLLAVVLAGADAPTARAFVAAVAADRRVAHLYDLRLVASAVELAADGAQLTRLVERLELVRAGEETLEIDAATALARAGRRDLAAELVLGEPAVVLDLGRCRRLLRTLGHATPADPPRLDGVASLGSLGWIEAQPPELRPALRALAAFDPAAEATARRLLRRDLRDRASLERELATLRRSGDGAGVARRRAALEERIAAGPAPLPPTQAARLIARLGRAADRAWLARWREALTAELRVALERRLAPAGPLDPLLGPDELLLVDAVAELDGDLRSSRRLGLELLARRCGSPPWDLGDHPANVAFRQRMERLGVDLGPWLEAPFRRRVVAADGRELEIALADDPLDVLRMGAPFDTCLSPWDFNFYSAVANAVDLNKRVAFARDGAGRIVGRCLLTLAEGPALVAFFPYCHEPALAFGTLIAAFVAELATAMGVPVRPAGEVRSLAAPKWYDDGPRDLLGVHAFLAEGAPFRVALASIAPAALPAALAAACAPAEVDELALERLLALPEVRDRPELVVPLLPLLERRRLTSAGFLRAAGLARRAGAVEPAAAWVRRHAAACLDTDWAWNDLPREQVETVVELEPSLALRLLRASRPPGVRRWQGDSEYRLYFAARAHAALRRPAQAAALYRLAGVEPPAG